MAGRVASGAKPVVIQDLRDVELVSPHLRRRGIASLVAIPLRAEGRVIGVAHAGSVERNFFDEDDLRLFELMADRLALALTQLTLFEAERAARRDAERAHRRLSFLAEASTILASSLDYQTTLRAVARLVVPHLADWCAVHIARPEGGLERVALAHADIARRGARGARRRPPAGRAGRPGRAGGGRARGLRGARARCRRAEVRAMYGGDADGAAELERLGFASYLCVPMHGRDQVLGHGDVRDRRSRPAASTRPTSRSPRSLPGAPRLRSRTRCSSARPRSAGGRPECSPPSPTGCSSSTPRECIRLWNPAAEAITGLRAADVLNLPGGRGRSPAGTRSRPGSAAAPMPARPPRRRRPCRSRFRGVSSGSRSRASGSPTARSTPSAT